MDKENAARKEPLLIVVSNFFRQFFFLMASGIFLTATPSDGQATTPSSPKTIKVSRVSLTSQKEKKKTKNTTEPQYQKKTVPEKSEIFLHSRQAILLDFETGEVLFEKNADERMAPSSMSKILTTYLVFEALKSGRVKMTDTFSISEKAWRKKGSKMFVTLGSQVTVKDLLKGAVIQSGNDACIALAEGLDGSEEAFSGRMTEVAHEIGLKNSHFVNATGWPDENHYSTARDLGLLARQLIQKFPEYYPLYGETEFIYNNIRQMNRNPLLKSFQGADGLKTGATDAGGFGLVGSAVQKGWRLILVMNGAKTKKERAIDARSFMQWGFSHFTKVRLYQKGQIIDQAKVWMAQAPDVGLTVDKDVSLILSHQEAQKLKVFLVYHGPLEAPVQKGQKVGHLVLTIPNKPDTSIPVLASESVGKAGFFSKISLIFSSLKL